MVLFLCPYPNNMATEAKENFRYLALGDSYTIGEAVPQPGTFPYQLARLLEQRELIKHPEIKVIAKTGWTTAELKQGIARAKPKGNFGLVTLLIGVNNQYRGYDVEDYKPEFEDLLKQAIAFAGGNAAKVIVVAIPDYGCTPFGEALAYKIDKELRAYNAAAQSIATKYHVRFVDIFDISKQASARPELIAEDKLHPSATMYSLWAEKILPVAEPIVSLP